MSLLAALGFSLASDQPPITPTMSNGGADVAAHMQRVAVRPAPSKAMDNAPARLAATPATRPAERHQITITATHAGEYSVDRGTWTPLTDTVDISGPPTPIDVRTSRNELVDDTDD